MGAKRPRPVILDADALIAIDRADRRVVALLELSTATTPSPLPTSAAHKPNNDDNNIQTLSLGVAVAITARTRGTSYGTVLGRRVVRLVPRPKRWRGE